MVTQKQIRLHAREASKGDGAISSSQDILSLKTGRMMRLERMHQMDIRDILRPTLKGCDLAKALGVSEATVCKWRQLFSIAVRNSGQYTRVGRKGRH